MGYGEEMALERLIDELIDIEDAHEHLVNGLWTTKDGETLRMTDMGTPHIHNCIKMLERNKGEYGGEWGDIAEQYILDFKGILDARFPPTDPAFADWCEP